MGTSLIKSLISEYADNNKPLISSLLLLLNYFLTLLKTKILMVKCLFWRLSKTHFLQSSDQLLVGNLCHCKLYKINCSIKTLCITHIIIFSICKH